jgi:pilus assembly protein CpaE
VTTTLTATLAGSRDRQLEELMQTCGLRVTVSKIEELATLAQTEKGSTLLIDLHLAYGDAAVYLGTEPRFSVIDALENVHRLDKTFLNGLVGHARAGLSLLASSDRASATPVDTTSVRTLIESAARHYRYVVLDVPRSDVMIDALEPASRIIIVANQELATVRAATRLSAALRQRYGKDRLSVVVSRYDIEAEIGQSDVERVLGTTVAHTFPSNYRIALDALNTGRPVVLDNHNKLAAAFSGFARGLVDSPDDAPSGKRQPGLLGRLTGKRA